MNDEQSTVVLTADPPHYQQMPVQAPQTTEATLSTVGQPNALADMWNDPEQMKRASTNARILANSALVPQNFQGKPENCLIAIDLANRMAVSPLFIMQNLYVVKGKPSWSGQACMSLILANKQFTNVETVYFGEKGTDNRGCRVIATRVSNGKVVEGPDVTIQMAKAEGWTNNPKWRNMPELMLSYRAAAFFARVYCPDSLMGVQTTEEIEDTMRPKQNKAPNPLGGIK